MGILGLGARVVCVYWFRIVLHVLRSFATGVRGLHLNIKGLALPARTTNQRVVWHDTRETASMARRVSRMNRKTRAPFAGDPATWQTAGIGDGYLYTKRSSVVLHTLHCAAFDCDGEVARTP